MKSLLCKTAIMGLMALSVMTSASAMVQCKVHNARGQVWYGTAPTRAGATANAMRFCVRNSVYAKNCVVDWCQGGGEAYGQWQCNAGNARGQAFVGTGPTRAAAAANVMAYCSANSAYARNCYIKSCFRQ